MNYWMDHDLKKISGDAPAYPEHAIESWLALPVPATEDKWKAVTGRFSWLLAELATLADSDGEKLDGVIRDAGSQPRESTVREMVMQISAHNSYHAGQIALLRRQCGAWPPRRGGDSW